MPKYKSIKKVLVIGSGPIIIGQAAEFDYAGTQACRELKKEGLEVVLINSNPATIMTDKNMADKIYIEPLTVETVKKIIEIEKPDSILPNLGGQTGLNLAMELEEAGFLKQMNVKLLGTGVDGIRNAEDRQCFKDMMEAINEPCIASKVVHTVEDAVEFTKEIGLPVIIRPAYTLGGTGGGIAYTMEELEEIAGSGIRMSRVNEILVEKCITGWKEIEFEVMRDRKGNAIAICSMENIDPVGVHTGDSIVVAPAQTLSNVEYTMLKNSAMKIIEALKIEGGCNVQFALHPTSFEYAVIEVNPRVSRSSALASKATGYPIAKVSSKIALGYTLDEIKNEVTGKTFACFEPTIDYVVVKIPKWPFKKFLTANRTLGTQMKATGEVMAIAPNLEAGLMKAIRSLEENVEYLRLDSLATLEKNDIEEKLSFHNQRQKEVLEKKYPNCMECMARVEGPSAALWERHPQENDFMNLRLGTGEVPSSATVTVPHSSLSLKEDEYDKTPQELAEKYHMVSDAPIVSEFLKYGNCGLVGKREDTIAMARSMIIQVASLHSYEEVKIIGLYPESEQEMWDWMRWLPHCTDDGHNVRFVASNVSESAPVLDVWKKVLDRRKEQKENLMYQQKVLPLPYLLFVVADSKLIMDTPIGNYLQMNQPALGMGAIILSESVSEFPHSVQNIVELYGTIGRIYQRERSNEKVSFIPEYAPQELKVLDTYARKMAPIRLRGGKGDQGLPSMLTFLDGLHIKNVEQLEIGDYWLNCSPERSLAVPIGVRSNGKPFYFNIHEKGHGPHGIVAGKTGSGKTEMVQTWITSMALQFSPEDVNFVLVDFKGTGLLEPFQNLPHLAGKISNLDKDITRNLTSLNSEMARRMTILKNTSSKDILQYRERCKVHPKWEKLPFLILIFDEFADFKQQFPEFMGTIDSILREGRSIGVYAVLMAQNPSGITTEQTNANIGFRWCLKVASDAASREIIGKTDAASILNPGRAYVKSSTPEGEVYELIQSYYAGAEYNPDKEEENKWNL